MQNLNRMLVENVLARSIVVIIFAIGSVVLALNNTPAPDWYKDVVLIVIGGYFGSMVPAPLLQNNNKDEST